MSIEGLRVRLICQTCFKPFIAVHTGDRSHIIFKTDNYGSSEYFCPDCANEIKLRGILK